MYTHKKKKHNEINMSGPGRSLEQQKYTFFFYLKLAFNSCFPISCLPSFGVTRVCHPIHHKDTESLTSLAGLNIKHLRRARWFTAPALRKQMGADSTHQENQ